MGDVSVFATDKNQKKNKNRENLMVLLNFMPFFLFASRQYYSCFYVFPRQTSPNSLNWVTESTADAAPAAESKDQP